MPKINYDIKTIPRRYADLVDILAPRPIHSEAAHKRALRMVRCLAGHELSRDQDDYIDALATFVERYEDQQEKVPEGTPLDVLGVLMESHAMSAYALGKLLGDPSLGSKILRGERDLSKAHIRKLCDHFTVSADLLIG